MRLIYFPLCFFLNIENYNMKHTVVYLKLKIHAPLVACVVRWNFSPELNITHNNDCKKVENNIFTSINQLRMILHET